jgi:hypothetical protein
MLARSRDHLFQLPPLLKAVSSVLRTLVPVKAPNTATLKSKTSVQWNPSVILFTQEVCLIWYRYRYRCFLQLDLCLSTIIF